MPSVVNVAGGGWGARASGGLSLSLCILAHVFSHKFNCSPTPYGTGGETLRHLPLSRDAEDDALLALRAGLEAGAGGLRAEP